MPVTIAIVGAGPSGFYAAEALARSGIDCRVDIIERLPAPYGLIRYGVAPDHEKTRKVTRSFDRTAGHERVGYHGNVELGRDLTLEELRGLYDAVVIATGAPLDRPLEIPGADKSGVYGAAAFVGWYNGHPDFRDLDPRLDSPGVAIIGNGNVALDVARILAKTPQELSSTDLPDYAAEALRRAPIAELYLFGRRGPVQAKWANVELREMGHLADCLPVVDPAQLPESIADGLSERDRRLQEKNLATLRGFAALEAGKRRKRVCFSFYAKPLEVLGGGRVEALRLERTRVEAGRAVGTGETFEVPCGLVVSSIGYCAEPIEGLPFDEGAGAVINRDGRVAEGLYVIGWAKRGPIGVISSNKPDGVTLARQIAGDFGPGKKPGGPALEKLLAGRGARWIGFADWKTIDAAEVATAPPGAPRRKLIRVDDMLAVLEPTARPPGEAG
ncbi:MAG: FAD-dependent oxidoreductase [Rhodospirillales bacterium]|nr:FAD-dependent oxidoreductase [Rhodospirillales bacterium]MDH3912214.1 FAD-dependent oxidoreductase [Rhodospirillales bacterium]MDH3967721.1 FAD-dependent oxidoreductase [Rhodospirillales bacterium]